MPRYTLSLADAMRQVNKIIANMMTSEDYCDRDAVAILGDVLRQQSLLDDPVVRMQEFTRAIDMHHDLHTNAYALEIRDIFNKTGAIISYCARDTLAGPNELYLRKPTAGPLMAAAGAAITAIALATASTLALLPSAERDEAHASNKARIQALGGTLEEGARMVESSMTQPVVPLRDHATQIIEKLEALRDGRMEGKPALSGETRQAVDHYITAFREYTELEKTTSAHADRAMLAGFGLFLAAVAAATSVYSASDYRKNAATNQQVEEGINTHLIKALETSVRQALEGPSQGKAVGF